MLLEANIRKMLVDGSQWASWSGYHIPVSEEYFVIWTPAGTTMHWRPGDWVAPKHQLTYFWRNTWFTIHISYDKTSGHFLSGYCDVVLPNSDYSNVTRELIYTDLYIDVVVREDYSVYTKDHEVFERASQRFPIVEQARKKSYEALDYLEQHAKTWSGPFACMPRLLPQVDFAQMSPDEAAAVLNAAS